MEPKLSPLQLMIRTDEKRCDLGSVYKNMERAGFKKLERAAVDFRAKLMALQEKASICGLEYRAKNNLRRSGNAKTIFFHPVEQVWLSEKEVASGSKDKAKPRWCEPCQIPGVITEHIYEVQDVDGKTKVRHSTLLIPFAPVWFLPNPPTKLTYSMDKETLEVKSLDKLVKEDEKNLTFEVRWRGFSKSKNTHEPLVEELILKNPGSLRRDLFQYLKVLYPDKFEVDAGVRALYTMGSTEESSYPKKLVYEKIIINATGEWQRFYWSNFETEALRQGTLSIGFDDFAGLKELSQVRISNRFILSCRS
eukprot:snap_masked-scaffold_70-processed-gene-0.72-mRNA-1 protein AED:1.00 eAED:1.00 QI:0/0/0/0/1/1/2/0/306